MIKQKIGKCSACDSSAPEQPLITDKCKTHYWKYRSELKKNTQKPKTRKPISKISKKKKIELAKYTVLRIQFLGKPENRKCPITGEKTTDIHHMKGRTGDLFLDTRFWLAVSRNGHRMIEENPEWAKEKGYSLNRL